MVSNERNGGYGERVAREDGIDFGQSQVSETGNSYTLW